jgi:DoxX-like family
MPGVFLVSDLMPIGQAIDEILLAVGVGVQPRGATTANLDCVSGLDYKGSRCSLANFAGNNSHVREFSSARNVRERFMTSNTQTTPTSKTMLWAGRIVSALPVLMLLLSAVTKLVKPDFVVKGFAHLGWDESLALVLAIVELTCTLIYLIPQTAVLGAILLTGYLGGATATHVRVGDPFFGPIVFGVLVWLGLFLRDARLRALLPLRR